MLYFTFIIPILICVFYFFKFKKNINFIEFIISLALIPLSIIVLTNIYSLYNGRDYKVISGYVVGKKYIPAHTETRVGIRCTGSGKYRSCSSYTYIVHIPDDYDIYISKNKPTNFLKYRESYNGESYGESHLLDGIDVNKNFYYNCNLGDCAAWTRYFHNPLKLSKTTLFRIIKDKKYPKLDIPTLYNYIDINRITFLNQLKSNKDWHRELNELNSKLNYTNINIGLIFTTYGDDFGEYLSNIWRNGNPNDLILILKVNNNSITGCKIIAWDNEYLKIKIKDDIINNKINIDEIDKILDILEKNIKKIGFVEKNMSNFNYLKIEFPIGYIIFLYLFTIIETIIVLEFFKMNDF